MDKKNFENKNKYYKFALYLIILVLINLVGTNLFFRVDLTSNELYSLSKASKNVVSTLKEPLTINVFFSKNLPSPYNNIERYLHDLLEEYGIHANNHLSYSFYNVSAKEGDLSEKAEENRKMAQSYGIYPVNVQKIEQDEAKVQRAYMGIVFIHGDIIEKMPAVTTTEGLEYKITTTIKRMNNKISALLNLPEKIKIKLIQSSSINQIASVVKLKGLNELKYNIKDLVNKLSEKNYDQLEFVYIDPSKDKSIDTKMERYERFSLQWNEFKTSNEISVPAGKGILAIGMEYGDRSFEKQLLEKNIALTSRGLEEKYEIIDIKNIEKFINENVDNLININEDIGYLSSNGTLSISPQLPPQYRMLQPNQGSLTKFNSLLSKNYTIKQIDLKSEDITDSIDTLIIAGAKENFSDWELFQIDQFLMKGKSLAIFMDAFQEIQQKQKQMYGLNQPVYLPLNTGLERLLDHYGAKVKKSYLMDESCYINRDRNTGEMPIYFAPIIKDKNINHDFPFMENIKELIILKASPLEADKEKIKENGLKSYELLSSSDKSWEMSGRINLIPMFIKPPASDKDKKSRSLAYLLEGSFPSYFAEKPVPEKPKKADNEKEEEGKNKEKPKPKYKESELRGGKGVLLKGRPGKIFLIGSTEILKNNLLDEGGNSPNAQFLLNIVDYLNNQQDIAVMRSKNQKFNPIKDTKPGTRTFAKIVNIGGLPLLCILFGIFIWFRRKIKRKKIQAMFRK
jgi:ABC-type uncharacterized transport system involved in gliding motility auxiliary subunit